MISDTIKSFGVSILALLLIQVNCSAQITDTSLIKKLSIRGVCLCNTTLSSLKQINGDFKEVDVEEMDIAKACIGQDSRFIAGKGYYSEKYPGLIFQKDQNTDQISKIRLTKQFSGNLPDGKFIDMNGLLLKDLLKMYPKLKNTWGSRGCSEYWNFSNDTLSFYVKIDKNKQPQFPIDESYYADKPVEAADLKTWCYTFEKHEEEVVIDNHTDDPIIFLDSIRVNRGVIQNYEPSEIASITVYKDTNAIKRIGVEGKNGLIYIETKVMARKHYWQFFKSKSADYLKAVPVPESDSLIQYVLNGKILETNYEGDLSSINDKTFKQLTIINKQQLIKDYNVTNKDYGVVILTEIKTKQK